MCSAGEDRGVLVALCRDCRGWEGCRLEGLEDEKEREGNSKGKKRRWNMSATYPAASLN